ncbi:MAG: hypothetical protein ABI690_16815 [Chloroflexota bacterium]
MNEKEIWIVGRKAAKEVASRYLSLQINFTASPVPDNEATFAEVFIASKGARKEQLYPLGILLHSDVTLNEAKLQRKLEKIMEQKVHEFLSMK